MTPQSQLAEGDARLNNSATPDLCPGQPLVSRVTLPSAGLGRNVLYRWAQNLRTALSEDSGWRLAGKLFALLWGLAGLWLTWQTFQTNLRLEQLRHAEEAYASLLADLGSDSGRLRADALGRVPGLLTQRVYTRAVVSPWESLKLLVGIGVEGQPAFLDPMRRQLHEYVHAGAVGKSNEQAAAGESKALVNALSSLGPEGWFFGEAKPDPSRRKNLAWLWATPPEGAQNEAISLAHSLFRGAQLNRVEFSGFELTGADFTGAVLNKPLFTKAILNDSSFREARLSGADLSNAQLRRAQMQKVHFDTATLYGCEMQSTNLGGAVLENSFISRVVLAPLPGGPPTDLSRVEFVNCTISDIDAQGANLFGIRITKSDPTFSLGATHSDFSGSDLRSSLLDNGNFSDSRFVGSRLDATSARFAHFNFADLRGANLDKADLTGADLSDAQGLSLADLRHGRGIGSCTNTNLANVKGINRDQLAELIKKGAVVIESEIQWRAFKQQGFPAPRWKEFANPKSETP